MGYSSQQLTITNIISMHLEGLQSSYRPFASLLIRAVAEVDTGHVPATVSVSEGRVSGSEGVQGAAAQMFGSLLIGTVDEVDIGHALGTV